MGTDSATLQSMINRYNKMKKNNCSYGTNCALNKRLLKLEIDFKKAELGLETGEFNKWRALRESIQLKKGPGGLRKKVNEITNKFSNDLEKTFNDIISNLEVKAHSVNNQNAYMARMNEMIEFYNKKHNGIQNKYNKVINKNSINKRLASFYETDEEYIKPIINILEFIYWPLVIIISIVLLFEMFKGNYPTMKDKLYPIFIILFFYIFPYIFRKFSNTFKPYKYSKNYIDTDVDDPKRYKNLAK